MFNCSRTSVVRIRLTHTEQGVGN